MRSELTRHFDVVVVVWALALAVAFSVAILSRAQLPADQWTYQPDAPHWVFPNSGN